MQHLTVAVFDAALSERFAESVLGLYLDDLAAEVFALGQVLHLAPGAALAPTGPNALGVVLEGRLAGPHGWYGPGNHVRRVEAGLAALEGAARLWLLDLGAAAWQSSGAGRLRVALDTALCASERAEQAAMRPVALPDPAGLCDHDHPEIGRCAARLRRASEASTAEAILKFVQPMPYRFGAWQERASETLARGVGMCTTKANLQVALMRAAGLKAGFARGPMPMAVLGKLMPEGWQALQRPMVKHYFAVVSLGGRWHASDASFDDAAYCIYARHFPEGADQRYPGLAEGRPYAPALRAAGLGDWDFTFLPDLIAEMGKTSRFGPAHFEALNTRLDRARGAQQGRIAALGGGADDAGAAGKGRMRA